MTARSHMQPVSPSAATAAPGTDGSEAQSQGDEPPLAASRLTIDVVMDSESWEGFGDAEAAVLTAAAALACHPGVIAEPCEAVIALSGDDEVARLNGVYRQKPEPTNVLSFPAAPHPAPGDEVKVLGDIILARETILREAADGATSPVHHLQHLVIHGLLHLLGYDHLDDAGAERMEALETAILATLAIPDPYANECASGGQQ